MKSICFVSFYEIKEYINSIKNGFDNYLYTIYNYPLYKYIYDSNDKIDNYEIHFLKYISKLEPDIMFWVFFDSNNNSIINKSRKTLKNTIMIAYLMDYKQVCDQFVQSLNNFDIIIINNLKLVDKLVDLSIVEHNKILYIPMCYDDNLYKPLPNLDQSKFTDLLYINNIFDADRVSLIKQLVNYSVDHGTKLSLYGSIKYQEIYPQYYVSTYSYYDLPIIINNCKLVICDDINMVPKILACNKKIAGIGIDMLALSDYYIGYYQQIDTDKLTKLINNNFNLSTTPMYYKYTSYTYKNMITKLHSKLCIKYFDIDFYQKTYNLNFNENAELGIQHWLKIGIKSNFLPMYFKVPNNFDDQNYANSLKTQNIAFNGNKHYLYYHWKNFSNNHNFITDASSIDMINEFDPKLKIIINTDNLINILSMFSKIDRNIDEIDVSLKRLSDILDGNYNIDINWCLKYYFKMNDQTCNLYLENHK